MTVLSVNVGRLKELPGKSKPTAIDKRPVDAAVRVTKDGLAGDTVGDKRHHGGPDQAVYVYGQPDYDWWEAHLDRKLKPGMFGENVTVSDFLSADAHVGDRIHIGTDVVLEITAARIPCGTLEKRVDEKEFVTAFRDAGRPGAYCRVIREGETRAGDEVRYVKTTLPDPIGVAEMARDFYDRNPGEASIRRYLASPVAARVRRDKIELLEKLNSPS
jgi:MOSC domain-containing protein YiiM